MSRRLSTSTALAVFLFAAPLRAQLGVSGTEPTPAAASGIAASLILPEAPVAVAPSALSLAPTRANGVAGVRTSVASTTLVQPAIANVRSGNAALMIIGGAGLLVGALISGSAGTVIMVGGGVIGLIGLWNYLNQ